MCSQKVSGEGEMPSTYKEIYWDIGHTRLHLLVYPDNGPTTLFLHANGMCAGTYGPLLDVLTGRLHLAAADLPGHGQSGPPAVSPIRNWDSFIADLQTLISRYFKAPINVVGHSLGAMVAYMTAARSPELVKNLVMIDPGILPRRILWIFSLMRGLGLMDRFHLVKAARRRKYLFDSRQDAARRFMSGKGMFKTWDKAFIQAYLDCALDFSQMPGRLRCHPETEAQIFASMPKDPWMDALKIECPVLLLRGQYSDVFFAGAAQRLSRKIRDCRLQTIPDTTHFLPMEKPNLVAAAILDYLNA